MIKKLKNLAYGKNKPTIKILQWGSARSIIEITHHNQDTQLLMIDNDYLMTLDEMGLVI